MVIRRRRVEGELIVEQTRDLSGVAAMLTAAGMTTEGITWSAGCYLMAYLGSESVGVVGIETKVDAALMRSLAVIEPMRRRGVGKVLVEAARAAAHTRGARRLYCFADAAASNYLKRFGFKPASIGEVQTVLAGTFMVDNLRTQPDKASQCHALCLDISHDGLILR
jgi:N-acetylglutamate synthase-like GNAT family acetyltransferase